MATNRAICRLKVTKFASIIMTKKVKYVLNANVHHPVSKAKERVIDSQIRTLIRARSLVFSLGWTYASEIGSK